MIAAADFWSSIRPSGLTAEQELVELWTRLRDCTRPVVIGGGSGMPIRMRVPRRFRRRDLDDEEVVLLVAAALTLLNQ